MRMAAFLGVSLVFCGAPGNCEVKSVKTWPELIDAAKANAGLEKMRGALIERARTVAGYEIVRRVYKLEDVGKHRTWLDHRADALDPDTARTFALAMSDFSACNSLANELPTLAAAYRLTGEAVFRDRVLSQLEEMTSWSPLQRPGWTCYEPGRHLPPDGKDGNWLATGTGIRAIADTLEILPEGTVSPDLRARLEKLLASEIDSIVDDWKTKRPWFVAANNPITNQWVLPTEGLVRACLVLGPDKHRDAYELGVRNLLMAMDAHGAAGEFEEGMSYADFTVTSMLAAARAMALSGDRRAMDRPFLKRFPTWIIHHLQPGGSLVNCFDAGGTFRGNTGILRPMLSLCAICTGSEVARWGLKQVGGCTINVPVLLAYALPPVGDGAAPPAYASYERATMVVWRSGWDENASGVWIRGGHETDQHDHFDRGHGNLIFRGNPVLVECGTPAYHMKTLALSQSCAGHNVLQIGSANALARPAPITVSRLDASGGDVTVDPTKCYEGLDRWSRRVQWSASEMTVTDQVETQKDKPEVLTFRWHLGTDADVSIQGDDKTFTVTWRDTTLTLTGSQPLVVTQEKSPDYTLVHRDWSDESREYVNTCVVVRTKEKTAGLTVTTSIADKPS